MADAPTNTGEVWVWRCEAGHETVHSETLIRSLRVYPRCPFRDPGYKTLCWRRLVAPVRPFPSQSAVTDG